MAGPGGAVLHGERLRGRERLLQPPHQRLQRRRAGRLGRHRVARERVQPPQQRLPVRVARQVLACRA